MLSKQLKQGTYVPKKPQIDKKMKKRTELTLKDSIVLLALAYQIRKHLNFFKSTKIYFLEL